MLEVMCMGVGKHRAKVYVLPGDISLWYRHLLQDAVDLATVS